MQDASGRRPDEREVSLYDLALLVRKRWRLLATAVVATTLLALAVAVFSAPIYRASVIVAPQTIETGTQSGLGSLGGSLGGLASLAGLGGGEGGGIEQNLALLRSRELAERFIERHGVMRHLFSEKWDKEAGGWKQGEPGLVSRAAKGVSRTLAWLSGDEGWREERGPGPSLWEAYKDFDGKIRRIGEDVQTGIVTVDFEFRDLVLAARWANDYIAMANAEIREKAVAESTRALAYLDEEVQKTTVAGVRDTIFTLVEAQLEKIMLANSRPEYAFKVLDRAVVPEENSHPKRALIVVLAFMLGGMVEVFAALVKDAWKGGIAGEIPGGEPAGDAG